MSVSPQIDHHTKITRNMPSLHSKEDVNLVIRKNPKCKVDKKQRGNWPIASSWGILKLSRQNLWKQARILRSSNCAEKPLTSFVRKGKNYCKWVNRGITATAASTIVFSVKFSRTKGEESPSPFFGEEEDEAHVPPLNQGLLRTISHFFTC